MTFRVTERDRLDRFLALQIPGTSRTRLAEWIAEGRVKVNRVIASKAGAPVMPNDEVECDELENRTAHDLAPADVNFRIVLETNSLLVVDKPRGLAVHPASSLHEPSLVNGLLARSITLSEGTASFRPGIVHRLDKDTTGLLLIAKNDSAHERLAKDIETKKTERRYLALVEGAIAQELFTVDAPIGRDERNRQKMAVNAKGKSARTHGAVWRRIGNRTLVGLRLETGRTHQIRVHLKAIGHPVVGDALYGHAGTLSLHAGYLQFSDPDTEERREACVAPPVDFGVEVTDEEAMEFLQSAPFPGS